MKMYRRLNTVVLFIVLVMGLTMTSNAQPLDDCIPAEGAPIRIGAVFPQVGLFTVRSAEPYQGAQAMLDAFNACGGANGRPVEWVFIPANDRQEAEAAAQEIIAQDIPLIVGSGSLAVLEALEQVAEENEIILWEVSEPILSTSQWVFSPRPTSLQLGAAATNFVQSVLPDALGFDTLRPALYYNSSPRGDLIATGIESMLNVPLIELENFPSRGDSVRDQNVNVMMVAAFDGAAESIWRSLQFNNANIDAWVQVGTEISRRDLCERIGNYDGMFLVGPSGDVSESYRETTLGELYTRYVEIYRESFGERPSERADLSASGLYMLLRYVLPEVQGAFTPGNVRDAILNVNIDERVGLMGEGLAFGGEGLNQYASTVIQQSHDGEFCTVWPGAIATCEAGIQTFPTWRERVLLEEELGCG